MNRMSCPVAVLLASALFASAFAAPGRKTVKVEEDDEEYDYDNDDNDDGDYKLKVDRMSIGVGKVSGGRFGPGAFSIGHGGNSKKGGGGHGGNVGENSYGSGDKNEGNTGYAG